MTASGPSSRSPQFVIAGLAIPPYDHETHTYTGTNPTQSVYRRGGAGGVVVATMTRTFDAGNLLLTQTLTLA